MENVTSSIKVIDGTYLRMEAVALAKQLTKGNKLAFVTTVEKFKFNFKGYKVHNRTKKYSGNFIVYYIASAVPTMRPIPTPPPSIMPLASKEAA